MNILPKINFGHIFDMLFKECSNNLPTGFQSSIEPKEKFKSEQCSKESCIIKY